MLVSQDLLYFLLHKSKPGGQDSHRIDVHASKGLHDRSTSQQQHGRDQDVGHDAEEEEGNVRRFAPACICASTSPSAWTRPI